MQFLKKIPIHPTFYLFVLWFVCCGKTIEFFSFISVLFLHEFGHYFVSKKRGYTLEKFFIAPYGVCLNYQEKQFEKSDEIKIALAGPISNLIFSLAIISLWWIFPSIYGMTYLLVEESLFLALFNLLPAYPMDGGRVAVALLSNKFGRNKAVKIVKFSNVLFSVIFLCMFICSCFINFNPTFALAVVFLLSGLIQGEYCAKYQNSFVFKKRISNFSKPKILMVNDDMCFNDLLKKIDANCFTIFVVLLSNGSAFYLTEKQVIKYCTKNNCLDKINILIKS